LPFSPVPLLPQMQVHQEKEQFLTNRYNRKAEFEEEKQQRNALLCLYLECTQMSLEGKKILT